jgi:dissimilatory sulfite reductase (desulfoviridin) alpha/beta subunit
MKYDIEEDILKKEKNAKGNKRTICGTHMKLLKVVRSSYIPDDEREDIIKLIKEVYDMGKRMGEKLRDYHHKYVKKGGWRDNF